MSIKYWLGTVDQDLANAANWAGLSVPTSGDNAVFDAAQTGYVQGPMSGSISCDQIDCYGVDIWGGDYTNTVAPFFIDNKFSLFGQYRSRNCNAYQVYMT